MTRPLHDVAIDPRPGDVVELQEDGVTTQLRVHAVALGHVGYEEVGHGWYWTELRLWNARLTSVPAELTDYIGPETEEGAA